jgi:predicted nucleotidyltransferase
MNEARFGLPDSAIDRIRGVFARHPSVSQAVLYGSRAKGSHKAGSDIDLTLHGDALDPRELRLILEELDDLLLPYTVDLSIFALLDHPELRDHIRRAGVVFYQR